MAKPFMQRFTGLELYSLQKTASFCDECATGNEDETQHRVMPDPCKFSVAMEVARRLYKYDQMLEVIQKISSGRFSEL